MTRKMLRYLAWASEETLGLLSETRSTGLEASLKDKIISSDLSWGVLKSTWAVQCEKFHKGVECRRNR